MWRFLFLTSLLALAGCGSSPPVAVVDGSTPVIVEGGSGGSGTSGSPGVAGAPREGYYVVKKGDNLYRIAMAHGATTHDIVTWNHLTDETKIEIGQELRVKAPEGGNVEVMPIAATAPIVLVGDASVPGVVSSTVASGSEAAVRGPKGGKIAYSETALAEVRAMESGVPAPNPAEPARTTTSVTGATPTVPVAPVTPAVSATNDGIDWTWPVAGTLLRGFVGGGDGKEANRGIDLAGRKGEPIHAAAAGVVSFVGTLRGYGDFLVVRHGDDYISVYAHTSKILVKRNQDVTKGQKIAEVGSSDADQPKLHFEIRHKGEPVDPLKFLPSRQ